MLLNLCINARDAMPQGGLLHIAAANRRLSEAEAGKIRGARPGAWLTIEVADTGTGIAPEVLKRIWEPFFTTKPKGRGTGSGLATVLDIVSSHKGFIELHTEVGRGTTFRVYFPPSRARYPRQTGPHPALFPTVTASMCSWWRTRRQSAP